MIQITDKVNCCGCNACGDICTHDAITFKTDNEGFWYPEVDKSKCMDCHLCEHVCPVINIDKLKKNEFAEPECHAAIHKNLEVRFKSTSGGLFSAFAEKIYKDGGYVGGAIFGDKDFNVVHYISNNKEDLRKLRKSKYKQSSLIGFFKQVKALVKAGEKVMICGAPCQMAAMRAYLGYKEYDNLIILDYVCRGINSPKIDKCFRETLEEEEGAKLVYYKAKDKELGWHLMSWKFIFENGHVRYIPAPVNLFTIGYLKTGAFCRPSCYDCKFKQLPRIADITLADCWGIDKHHPEMSDDVGASLVMINNEKGRRFFEAIQQKVKSAPMSLADAIAGNRAIVQSLPLPHIDRERFFSDAERMDFNQLAEKYFDIKKQEESSFKNLLKNIKKRIHSIREIYKFTDRSLWTTCKVLRLNLFKRNIIGTSLKSGVLLKLAKHSILELHPKGRILLRAPFEIGLPRLSASRLESRVLVEENAVLEVQCPTFFMYGCDIEVFKGASLIIRSGLSSLLGDGANIGLTISCANRIEMGEDVKIGRNVTIRDNNGHHLLSVRGYKESKPVIIGNHVWICEQATIMQGVKIGDGAIIGARAVVYSNVPPYSIVSGNPAQVVDENVYWKY